MLLIIIFFSLVACLFYVYNFQAFPSTFMLLMLINIHKFTQNDLTVVSNENDISLHHNNQMILVL